MTFWPPCKDYFNNKKTRNIENTSVEDYNCGGYALKTFNWYLPWGNHTHSELAEDFYQEGLSKEEIQKAILKEDLKTLLTDFKDKLIYISSIEEASPKDTVIAYRLYVKIYDDEDEMCENVDTDFHFRVRINNLWSEKCGSCEIKSCLFTEGPWDVGGDCIYDGPILYFIFNDK